MAPFYLRERTDRDRLIAVIDLCEKRGWKETLAHAQEQFYLLLTGRIQSVF